MSHGSTEKCEPNLTPLLDLVLQLVMFFMLVANFAMEDTKAEIQLPQAVSGKTLDKGEGDPIFLNVNQQGIVLLTTYQREGDRETLDNVQQVEDYMKHRAAEDMRKSGKKEVQSSVILRVDKRASWDKTYGIMKGCRLAGYQKVQLRVINDA
jgi:biopolymer transport protein ExbD